MQNDFEVLKVQNICKSFKGFPALNGINMTVNKGDIYGLVGENGSGKTTLMRIICGLTKPDSGSFSLFGVSSEDKKIHESRKGLGAVIEYPHFYLNMTARDNLICQCRLMGIDSSGADDVLRRVGLEDQIKSRKKVQDFSLGMKQRLGIGMAIIGNPQFIVLDEPMNGLDPSGIMDVRDLITELSSKGVTFLISSHILSELARVATKFGFVSKGIIKKEIYSADIDVNNIEQVYIDVMRGGR